MSDGLGEPLHKPPGAKVDVVFVDGFRNDALDRAETAWPPGLLEKTGRIARVFPFRYKATLDDFYPEPGSHTGTSIDDHSAELLRGFEAMAQAGDRPIILVARDLGGLVCANALSQQDANPAVVDNIRGLVFFETPFEGKAAARWAKIARDLPALDGLKMPSNLKERSGKLVDVNKGFLDFLESRRESLRVQYFYRTYEAATPLPDDDLVEVTDDGWGEVAVQLAQWVKEFGAPPAKREESGSGPGSIVVGDTHYHKEMSHIQGVVTGGIASTSRNGVRISGARSTYNYGKRHRLRDDGSSLESGPTLRH